MYDTILHAGLLFLLAGTILYACVEGYFALQSVLEDRRTDKEDKDS